MNKLIWTKEIPSKPGFYFFYGWLYGDREISDKKVKAEFKFIEVMTEKLVILNGAFCYEMNEHIGLYARISIAKLPDLEKEFSNE